MAEGVRVWAKWINDRGGVNGHPVEVVTGDDGGDPSRHRSLVQEFVEQRGVIAFISNPEALTGQGSVAYLTQAQVPVIGAEGAGQWFYESPVYFPQGSHGKALLESTVLTVAAVAKPAGITNVALINCVEAQVCRDSSAKSPGLYQKQGMKVVYTADDSIGQPDFTAECLNARNNNAQVISMGMDANAVRSIAAACARQNYHPLLAWTSGSASAAQGKDPNLEGALVSSIVASWPDSGTPATAEFHEAMAKYAPGADVTGGHMLGWVASKIFERATQQLPEPATAKAVLDALGAINGDVMPDLTGPLLFNPGQPATPTVCGFAVRIRGGAFVGDNSVGRVCVDYDPNI
jgi:branched-chain amino acid transport system substrate-binding protein